MKSLQCKECVGDEGGQVWERADLVQMGGGGSLWWFEKELRGSTQEVLGIPGGWMWGGQGRQVLIDPPVSV